MLEEMEPIAVNEIPWSKVVALFAIALIPRLLLCLTVQSGRIEDSGIYFHVADSYRAKGLFNDDKNLDPSARSRTPLYPLILVTVQEVSQHLGLPSDRVLMALNAFFFSGAVVLFFLAALTFLSEPLGFLSGLVWVFEPSSFPYSIALMPESTSVFFLAAAFFCFVRACQFERMGLYVASAACLAFATLAKPVFLWLEFPLVLWLLIWLTCSQLTAHSSQLTAHSFKAAAFHVCAFLLTLSPWFYRNWVAWGDITFTPHSGITLYEWYRPALYQELGGRGPGGSVPDYGTIGDPQIHDDDRKLGRVPDWDNLSLRSKYLGRLATRDILAHPFAFAMSIVKRAPKLFLGTGNGALGSLFGEPSNSPLAAAESKNLGVWLLTTPWGWIQMASWSALLSIYALFVIGIARGIRTGLIASLVAVALYLGYFILLVGPIAHTRYRFPMLPAIALVAAIGLEGLLRKKAFTRVADSSACSESEKEHR